MIVKKAVSEPYPGEYNEYGKVCQCCWKRTESRMFYQQIQGLKGAQRKQYKWRRCCPKCWELQDQLVKQGFTLFDNEEKRFETEIHIAKKDTRSGTCNACSRPHTAYHVVFEIKIGNNIIRLCNRCLLNLSKKMNMARHW
jgi:hypothetical protein